MSDFFPGLRGLCPFRVLNHATTDSRDISCSYQSSSHPYKRCSSVLATSSCSSAGADERLFSWIAWLNHATTESGLCLCASSQQRNRDRAFALPRSDGTGPCPALPCNDGLRGCITSLLKNLPRPYKGAHLFWRHHHALAPGLMSGFFFSGLRGLCPFRVLNHATTESGSYLCASSQ